MLDDKERWEINEAMMRAHAAVIQSNLIPGDPKTMIRTLKETREAMNGYLTAAETLEQIWKRQKQVQSLRPGV